MPGLHDWRQFANRQRIIVRCRKCKMAIEEATAAGKFMQCNVSDPPPTGTERLTVEQAHDIVWLDLWREPGANLADLHAKLGHPLDAAAANIAKAYLALVAERRRERNAIGAALARIAAYLNPDRVGGADAKAAAAAVQELRMGSRHDN
jgi:DnaJ-domain-containing protein 1